MEKKVLLAIDGSPPSRRSVRYAVRMSAVIRGLHVTLLHVRPTVSQFLVDEAKTSFDAHVALERLRRKNKSDAMKLLSVCRDEMIEMGFAPDRIELKTVRRRLGLAKDVIDLAQEGRYDAILAGRRGLSRLQELFMDSLTRNLVDHSQVIPVWIVDGDVTDQRILMAVDGSDNDLRAVDHVGFILGQSPEARITLLHVLPRLQEYYITEHLPYPPEDMETALLEGDSRYMMEFMGQAQAIFSEAGISAEQVTLKQVKGRINVGAAILDEAVTGSYGTVVMGRRGAGRSFFMGGVTRYVVDRLKERSVWLVG